MTLKNNELDAIQFLLSSTSFEIAIRTIKYLYGDEGVGFAKFWSSIKNQEEKKGELG